MKRVIIVFLVLIAVGAATVGAYLATHLPQIKFSVINFQTLSAERADVTAVVSIDNPLPISFSADSIAYSINMGGRQVLRSSYVKSVAVKAKDKSNLSLPFTVFAEAYSKVVEEAELQKHDSVDYEFTAVFYTDFFFKKRIEIKEKKRLPVFYLPAVEIKHLVLTMLRLSDAEIQMHTTITNKNVFDIEIKDVSYHFAVFGKRWAEGKNEGQLVVPARSTISTDLAVKISSKETGPEVFDILKKQDDVDYKMALNFKLSTGNELLGDVPVFIESKGTAIHFMKTMKKIRE